MDDVTINPVHNTLTMIRIRLNSQFSTVKTSIKTDNKK